MIKKMISRLSVLIVLMLFIASCSTKSEYTSVLPADATAVASIHLKSLIDKSGLSDKENESVKLKLLEALKSGMSAATFEQLEKVLKQPKESGIDVEAPIYVFTATSFPYATIAAKVSDVEQLRASLNVMTKEQICQPIAEGDGYNFTTIGEGTLLAFNKNSLVAVQTTGASELENAKKTLTTLMKQELDKSFAQYAGFQKMEEQKGDINFLASLASMPDEFFSQMAMGMSGITINPKEVMALGNLNFDKGKIGIEFEYYTENEEIKTFLKKQEKTSKKLNTTFLNYFPEYTVAFLNLGTDGKELYSLLQENQEFHNILSISQTAEVEALFTAFNGDVSVGLINIELMKTPSFIAYADITDGKVIKAFYEKKQLLGLKKNEDIIKLGENDYVFKSNKVNIFFGAKEKQMYATNDEILYKNIGKQVSKSIKDADYAANMKGKNFFFVLNIEAVLELPIVKMMIGFGGEEYQMYNNLASKINYLEVSSLEGNSNITLILKNKDINALKQIVDFGKQFVGM